MDLDWPAPRIHIEEAGGTTTISVQIAKVGITLDQPLTIERESWRNSHRRWKSSHCRDWSAWGHYEALARTGHFAFPTSNQPNAGWPEAHAAWLLASEGFTCWTSVQLFFPQGRTLREPRRLCNTRTVEQVLREKGYQPPRELADYVGIPLRNPDLVAHRPSDGDLRFCEVKVRDGIREGQIAALAMLYLLTGAPVTVVQLHEPGSQPRGWTKKEKFPFHGPPGLLRRAQRGRRP